MAVHMPPIYHVNPESSSWISLGGVILPHLGIQLLPCALWIRFHSAALRAH